MTAFLPAAHIANLRAIGPARSYTDRMVIKGTPAGLLPVPGRTGGWTNDLEVRATDVPCRLAPDFQPVSEQNVGGRIQDVARVVVYCATTVDIRADDELEIQPNAEEGADPIVVRVVRSEVRRTIDLERMTRGTVVGGRGTVTP